MFTTITKNRFNTNITEKTNYTKLIINITNNGKTKIN